MRKIKKIWSRFVIWFDYFLHPAEEDEPYYRYVESQGARISELIDDADRVSRLYPVFDLIEDFSSSCGSSKIGKGWYESLIIKYNNKNNALDFESKRQERLNFLNHYYASMPEVNKHRISKDIELWRKLVENHK